MVSQREHEQNLTNHNDLGVSGEDRELTEQLELAVEEAKEEEDELGEQLEITVKTEEEELAEQLELMVKTEEEELGEQLELTVKTEEEELAEQLELVVEKVKAEEDELAEQLELMVEKVKAEEEELAEELELVAEKMEEEVFTKQLPLVKEDELVEDREVTCWTQWGGRSFSRCCEENVTFLLLCLILILQPQRFFFSVFVCFFLLSSLCWPWQFYQSPMPLLNMCELHFSLSVVIF